MRIEANLLVDLWPEIVKAIGYIGNRTLVRKLEWKTPFEAIKKKKPQYAHMHVYGCRAYPLDYHIPKKKSLNHKLILDILLDMILQISIESRYQLIRKLFVHEMLQWTTTFYIIQ